MSLEIWIVILGAFFIGALAVIGSFIIWSLAKIRINKMIHETIQEVLDKEEIENGKEIKYTFKDKK